MKRYTIIFTATQEVKAKDKEEARELFLSGETLPDGKVWNEIEIEPIDVMDLAIEIEEVKEGD